MAGLLERVRAEVVRGEVVNSTWGPGMSWADFEELADQYFSFAGSVYPTGGLNTLYGVTKGEDIGVGLTAYVNAVMQSPPAFGAQLVRSLVLSQARFTFRGRPGQPNARKIFTTDALALLERPWPKGTTGELLTKMEWHEGLAGNAYVYRNRRRGRLKVLRPDWVVIVLGSELDDDDPEAQLDAEVLGYAYLPGGPANAKRIEPLLPEEVAHWSPLPDPLACERGMAWLTPVLRELQGDTAATQHKIKYFQHGATPNLVVKGVPGSTPDQFEEYVDKMESRHAGLRKAWKTIYLAAGADATIVGANLKDIDYRAIQGSSETRISVASRVPAPVLGISEGLQGSSLNAGNFGQARRNMADIWLYPTLQSVSAALGQVVDVPSDAELWFDTTDMPFVREDAKDAAEIVGEQMQAIRNGTDAGFEPDAVVDAVASLDITQLRGQHSGLFSVQLQKPGTPAGPTNGSTNGNGAMPAANGRHS